MEVTELLVPGRFAVFDVYMYCPVQLSETGARFCACRCASLNQIHIVNTWFCKFQSCNHFRLMCKIGSSAFFSLVPRVSWHACRSWHAMTRIAEPETGVTRCHRGPIEGLLKQLGHHRQHYRIEMFKGDLNWAAIIRSPLYLNGAAIMPRDASLSNNGWDFLQIDDPIRVFAYSASTPWHNMYFRIFVDTVQCFFFISKSILSQYINLLFIVRRCFISESTK